MKKKKVAIIAVLTIIILTFIWILDVAQLCLCYTHLKEIYIPLLSIAITGILSLMIFTANSRSAQIAAEMSNRELEREKNAIKIAANKLYLSVLNSYEYLGLHYKDENSLKHVYICEDWIDELSILNEIFDKTEMKKIFRFIKSMIVLDSFKNDNSYQEKIEMCCKSFCNMDFLRLKYQIAFNEEDYMGRTYFQIIRKLEKLSTISNLDQINEIKEFKIPSIREKKYSNGEIKYSIEYKEERINKIVIYNFEGQAIQDGEYKEGKFNGYLEKYDGEKIIEKGRYEAGNLMNGEQYHIYRGNNYENEEEICEQGELNIPCIYNEYYKIQKIKDGIIMLDKNADNLEYEYIQP